MADSIYLSYATEAGAQNAVDDHGANNEGRVVVGNDGTFAAKLLASREPELSESRRDRITSYEELDARGFFDHDYMTVWD